VPSSDYNGKRGMNNGMSSRWGKIGIYRSDNNRETWKGAWSSNMIQINV